MGRGNSVPRPQHLPFQDSPRRRGGDGTDRPRLEGNGQIHLPRPVLRWRGVRPRRACPEREPASHLRHAGRWLEARSRQRRSRNGTDRPHEERQGDGRKGTREDHVPVLGIVPAVLHPGPHLDADAVRHQGCREGHRRGPTGRAAIDQHQRGDANQGGRRGQGQGRVVRRSGPDASGSARAVGQEGFPRPATQGDEGQERQYRAGAGVRQQRPAGPQQAGRRAAGQDVEEHRHPASARWPAGNAAEPLRHRPGGRDHRPLAASG